MGYPTSVFSPTTKNNQITELIIFIKPHLMTLPDAAVKLPQTAQEQVDRVVDLSANREEIITFIGQGRFPEVPLTDFDRPFSTILPDPEPKKRPPVPTAELSEVIDPDITLPMVPEPSVPEPVMVLGPQVLAPARSEDAPEGA